MMSADATKEYRTVDTDFMSRMELDTNSRRKANFINELSAPWP